MKRSLDTAFSEQAAAGIASQNSQLNKESTPISPQLDDQQFALAIFNNDYKNLERWSQEKPKEFKDLVNIEIPFFTQRYPLLQAIEFRHQKISLLFIEEGVNLSFKNKLGQTALHLAIIHDLPDTAYKLSKKIWEQTPTNIPEEITKRKNFLDISQNREAWAKFREQALLKIPLLNTSSLMKNSNQTQQPNEVIVIDDEPEEKLSSPSQSPSSSYINTDSSCISSPNPSPQSSGISSTPHSPSVDLLKISTSPIFWTPYGSPAGESNTQEYDGYYPSTVLYLS